METNTEEKKKWEQIRNGVGRPGSLCSRFRVVCRDSGVCTSHRSALCRFGRSVRDE